MSTAAQARLTAAVDQCRAAADHTVDQLVTVAAVEQDLTTDERWLALWAGVIDSGASRETLAGAVVAAVLRLAERGPR